MALALGALLAFALLGIHEGRAGLPDVVQRIKPSVVAVGTFQKTRSPPFLFRGTGFVVDDGTLVATAAHVMSEAIKSQDGEILAVLAPGPAKGNPELRPATVAGVDKERDLAVLRIGGAPLPAVTLGNSDAVREGQSIALTGFPIGQVLGFHAITHRGIVASLTPVAIPAANANQLTPRTVEHLRAPPVTLFQLDATVYAGHSGSPVYDEDDGQVLGVITMGFSRGAKDPIAGQVSRITFAVPSRFLRDLIGKARP
jgi:S1-C subfamily serine protease